MVRIDKDCAFEGFDGAAGLLDLFHVTLDDSVVPFEYNYRTKAEWDAVQANAHVHGEQPFDLHGMSSFLRVEDDVHHTYSTYGRGTGERAGHISRIL